MSWKKRNQRLRGPKPRKTPEAPMVYRSPGIGVGYYADPRHKLKIVNDDGTWYYETTVDGVVKKYILQHRQRDIEKYDSLALPPPAVWNANVKQISLLYRSSYAKMQQKQGKRRRLDRQRKLRSSNYKAMNDVLDSPGTLSFDNFFTGFYKALENKA